MFLIIFLDYKGKKTLTLESKQVSTLAEKVSYYSKSSK